MEFADFLGSNDNNWTSALSDYDQYPTATPVPLEEIFDNLTLLLSNSEVAEVLRGGGFGTSAKILFGNDSAFFGDGGFGSTNTTTPANVAKNSTTDHTAMWETGRVLVPIYSFIFLLSVTGNFLVILTLIQNKRMRTVTNVFLLNLAFSDLLLGVVCMPFTLVGTLLRDFVFGEVMCKLIPYFQAVSVSVSAWTLVTISIERYNAICHPLKSRRWQTLSHAYKMIALVWIHSLVVMTPTAILTQLIPLEQGRHKCREMWPSPGLELAYNLFLDGFLLVVPLLVMSITYALIASNLWKTMRSAESANMEHISRQSNSPNIPMLRGILIGFVYLSLVAILACLGLLFVTAFLRILEDAPTAAPPAAANNNEPNRTGLSVTGQQRSLENRFALLSIEEEDPDSTIASVTPRSIGNGKSASCRFWKSFNSTPSPSPGLETNGNGAPGADSAAGSVRSSASARRAMARRSNSQSDSSPCIRPRFWSKHRPSAPQIRAVNNNSSASAERRHPFQLRHTNFERSLSNKKRVIKMLFVVVVEFFVCWTPLYVINTVALLDPQSVYMGLGYAGILGCYSFAYVSCCCNPITYCFMNSNFRKAFINVFGCSRRKSRYNMAMSMHNYSMQVGGGGVIARHAAAAAAAGTPNGNHNQHMRETSFHFAGRNGDH